MTLADTACAGLSMSSFDEDEAEEAAEEEEEEEECRRRADPLPEVTFGVPRGLPPPELMVARQRLTLSHTVSISCDSYLNVFHGG
jgi:hypothetical protein